MNCHNCGAPLVWDGLRPIVACDHCHTIRSASAPSESVDRVISLGRQGIFECPGCHCSMDQGAMDGLSVEYCTNCLGVLIEDELFAFLVRNRRAAFRGAASRPKLLDQSQLLRFIDCPSCHNSMEVHPYFGPGNVVIDSCCRCGLIWLDCSEISQIETASGVR